MGELMKAILRDEEIERQIIAQLQTYRDSVKQFRETSKLKDTWDNGYKLYKNMPLPYVEKEDWEANICLPYAHQYVETIVPRLIHAIKSVYPLFDITSEYPGWDRRADIAERYLNSILFSNDYDENLSNIVKYALCFGTALPKYRVSRQYGRTMITPEHTDIYDVGIDPGAKDVQGAIYAYHDVYKPVFHMMRMADEGVYNQKQITRILEDGDPQWGITPANLERLALIGLAPTSWTNDRVKISEWYLTLKEPTTGKYQEVMLTVANEKYIIRAEDKNPFGIIPFERVVLIPFPDEFYGQSIPQIIEDLIYEANEKRNQVLDANNMMINPIYLALEDGIGGEGEQRDIGLTPGEIVTVRQPGAIAPMQQNFAALHAGYQDLAVTDQNIKDAVGVQDYNRGMPTDGDSTATEVVSLINEGNMRFLMMIMWLENAMKKMGKNSLRLMKMNMQETESFLFVRETNRSGMPQVVKEFGTLSRDDIYYDMDIKCMAAAAYSQRAIDAQNTMQFAQIILKDPEAAELVSKTKLYKMMARSLNIRDLSFFKNESDKLPDQIDPQTMMRMLNANGGPMGGQPEKLQGVA